VQFNFPFGDTLVIPFGATSGRRIELDGVNGTITVYRANDTAAIIIGGSGAFEDSIRFLTGDPDELIGAIISSSVLGSGAARNLSLIMSAPAFNPATQFPTFVIRSQSFNNVEPPEIILDHDGSEGLTLIPADVGSATLVAGTVTVARTSIRSNSRILLSRRIGGGTLGFLTYTLSAGVSFTINSTSATDTSTVTWAVFDE